MATAEIDTPNGPARAHLHLAVKAKGALVLGHGAGGGVDVPDLEAATEAALAEGLSVVLVEQPYRVAGKKSQPAVSTIDSAWVAALAHLRADELAGLALITGGRSAGARVACRTAQETGAVAVLCLAFPLQPPARKGKEAGPDRLDELDGAGVPVLVVQGDRDRFGMPPEGSKREVVAVAGDHSLRKDPAAVGAAVRDWLSAVV